MELLVMIAIAAATLTLIWLIVREAEPEKVRHYEMPLPKAVPTKEEIFEVAQKVRANAGIPRAYPVTQKPVDKPAPKPQTSSSRSSGSSSSSRRDSDDSWTSYNSSSYSSWGGDSSSSSSSSCDSGSSSSSSSSCD
jgi:hypothetical protein